jgi:hypothetical protein
MMAGLARSWACSTGAGAPWWDSVIVPSSPNKLAPEMRARHSSAHGTGPTVPISFLLVNSESGFAVAARPRANCGAFFTALCLNRFDEGQMIGDNH